MHPRLKKKTHKPHGHPEGPFVYCPRKIKKWHLRLIAQIPLSPHCFYVPLFRCIFNPVGHFYGHFPRVILQPKTYFIFLSDVFHLLPKNINNRNIFHWNLHLPIMHTAPAGFCLPSTSGIPPLHQTTLRLNHPCQPVFLQGAY